MYVKKTRTHTYIYIYTLIFSEKLMSKIHGFPMKSPFFPGFPAEGTGNHWLGEQSGGGWEIGDGRLVNTLKLGFLWDLWWFVDVHFQMRDFIGLLCFLDRYGSDIVVWNLQMPMIWMGDKLIRDGGPAKYDLTLRLRQYVEKGSLPIPLFG